ncbi:hypothetical protein K7432_009983 [Basidiobolus ranarum]|uniref:Uncharacterized protein n=1 Tax=Basidiobolus ranarum TaxID=34480 RepID=A0ABR2VW63_9FUNG
MPATHNPLSYNTVERPKRVDSLQHRENASVNPSWSNIFSKFIIRRTKKKSSNKKNSYRTSKYEKLEFAEAKAELQKKVNDFEEIVTYGFSLDQTGSRQQTIRFSLTPKKLRHERSDSMKYPELSKSL